MVLSFVIFFIKLIITLNFNIPKDAYGILLLTPFFANYSLWLYKGKEKLFIENDSLEYVRTNGIITIRKNYEIKKIKNLIKAEKQFKSDSFIDTQRELIKETQRAFPFWLKMGKIKFQYENKNINILNVLDNYEMNEVFEILKIEIENRSK